MEPIEVVGRRIVDGGERSMQTTLANLSNSPLRPRQPFSLIGRHKASLTFLILKHAILLRAQHPNNRPIGIVARSENRRIGLALPCIPTKFFGLDARALGKGKMLRRQHKLRFRPPQQSSLMLVKSVSKREKGFAQTSSKIAVIRMEERDTPIGHAALSTVAALPLRPFTFHLESFFVVGGMVSPVLVPPAAEQRT